MLGINCLLALWGQRSPGSCTEGIRYRALHDQTPNYSSVQHGAVQYISRPLLIRRAGWLDRTAGLKSVTEGSEVFYLNNILLLEDIRN